MQNARLDEAQVGIKTDGRNINNLRYAEDITLVTVYSLDILVFLFGTSLFYVQF